jgi:hypothetical protein
MLSHHDTTPRQAPRDDRAAGVDALSVATFLKPRFRIGVAPVSGELQVQVELRPSDCRPRPLPRH